MIMKRSFILSILLCFILVLPAMSAPCVILDEKPLIFTDTEPIIEDGRTLVPLRAIFEAMGAEVSWDQSTQTAFAVKGNTRVALPIGSLQPTINGSTQQLDVAAKIVNERTLAPLRFVGEAFGGTVVWDSASQTITIKTGSSTGLPATEIKVHFIDVGQADAIYIELPDNNDILIDGGNVADGPLVVNYLKAQGVDDIELMIATHPYEDHIGGLPYVLNEFVVKEILDSGKTEASSVFEAFSYAANAEDCPWVSGSFQTYSFGNVTLKILTGSTAWNNANDYPVVCLLDTGNVEFLFTGDVEGSAESILPGDISAKILKVGHHGSNSSTTDSFLARVNPEVAIISVGAGNSYGHPSNEVLTRLHSAGAEIYRTDEQGTIIVTTNGNTYSINASPSTTVAAPIIKPERSEQFIGDKNTKKFHYLSICSSFPIPSNQVIFDSKEAAIDAGYERCEWCVPMDKPKDIDLREITSWINRINR